MLYRYHQHITERTAGANHQHTAGGLPADDINTTTTAAGGQAVTTTTTAAATQAHGERVPRGETMIVRMEWDGPAPEIYRVPGGGPPSPDSDSIPSDRLSIVAVPRNWRGTVPRFLGLGYYPGSGNPPVLEPGDFVSVDVGVYGRALPSWRGIAGTFKLELGCSSGAFDQDCRVYVGDGEGGWLQGPDDYDRLR